MYEAMADVDRIRILVGLNVDRYTVKLIDRVKEEIRFAAISAKEGKEILTEEIENEFEHAETSESVEKGVRAFIDWLKSGKLEMRMYTEASIHAKVYIMRKNPAKVPDTFGSTSYMTLPTLIAICSTALSKPPLSSQAILGDITISGTILKVKNWPTYCRCAWTAMLTRFAVDYLCGRCRIGTF